MNKKKPNLMKRHKMNIEKNLKKSYNPRTFIKDLKKNAIPLPIAKEHDKIISDKTQVKVFNYKNDKKIEMVNDVFLKKVTKKPKNREKINEDYRKDKKVIKSYNRGKKYNKVKMEYPSLDGNPKQTQQEDLFKDMFIDKPKQNLSDKFKLEDEDQKDTNPELNFTKKNKRNRKKKKKKMVLI